MNRVLNFIKSFDGSAFPAALQNLHQSLEEVSRELRDAEHRLDNLRRAGRDPARVPSVEELSEIVLAVEAHFKDNPTAAREALRRMLQDGRLTMEPLPDGAYRARSMILFLDLPPKSRKPRGLAASGASVVSQVVGNDGCAGAMGALFTAVSLGFERRIAA